MRTPKYLYASDFNEYREELVAHVPSVERAFAKGSQLWRLGENVERVYYIDSGVLKTSLVHEDGYIKTLYFTGAGTLYPGFHETQFNIERSLVTEAVTAVKAIEFRRVDLYAYAKSQPNLMAAALELYATWINLHIYESAHQEYNSAFRKLCNLVYLLCTGGGYAPERVDLTQQDLADVLALERENVSRFLSRLRKEGVVETHRGWFEVLDLDALLDYCSLETIAV